MTSTCVVCTIIYIFYHKQKPYPVILLAINNKLWANLYDAILLLNTAICLRIEGYRQLLLNVKKVI